MATPLQHYHTDLQRKNFVYDAAQEQAIKCIQLVYDDLVKANDSTRGLHLRNPFFKPKKTVIEGMYLWGQVGRGKTYLIDKFYDCLPFPQKTRLHYHRFMQQIHQELRSLHDLQNPLTLIAQRFARNNLILCLDEFFVSDITDAMLLGGLLDALFKEGVTLVATSNVPPDDLYKGGLQRDRFTPAINLIKQHTRVFNVDGGTDYRLRTLERAEIYHYPLDHTAEQSLLTSFREIAPNQIVVGEMLEINGRKIPTIQSADGIVWLDFRVLCNIPRAVSDYIEIAKSFNTVLLSNVFVMHDAQDDMALRFINLVDEFYDRSVKLVISAEAPPDQLYDGKRLAFQFQRTISRLQEMQSREYLERPHLP
jgi:cell division protein ZapE